MTFAAEPYGAFVDDLVSGLTGGVTRERFTYLDEQKPFLLGFAATAVPSTVRVQGLVGGEYFRFAPATDFDVTAGTIVWKQSAPNTPATGATWPDPGSDFYASYERTPDPQAPPLLTDRNPGSVVRTLAESFAREYAVVSRQLELVYRSAFLSTAAGRDLDQVVALVGVTRWTGTIASGEVVFSRATPAPAEIFIPAGTRVSSGRPPVVTVETTEDQTLRSGTLSVAAAVRSRAQGPAGVASGGALTVINLPILGIDTVTNPQALSFGAADETDVSLRSRAGRALEASGGATTASLVGALTSVEGIRAQDVLLTEDPVASPGLLKITVASQLDATHAALAASLIEQHRPAGIRVQHNLAVPTTSPPGPTSQNQGQDPAPPGAAPPSSDPVYYDIGITVAITPASASLTQSQKSSLIAAATSAVTAFADALGVGDTVIYNRLVAATIAVPGVYDVSLDLYPAGALPATGRSNLIPTPGDRRPRLAAGNLNVRLRGALIALDVSVEVERKGVAAVADAATALGQIRDDVTRRLQAQIGSGGAISAATLQGALPDSDTYAVHALVYVATFLEEGLLITQQNPEIQPTADQQAWIRTVQATEASRTT